jgi:hypothetical protein
MAPIHQFSFQSSNHQRILEHFSEALLSNLPSHVTKPTDINAFIQQTPLPGIQKHLYQNHQQQVKHDLHESAPFDLKHIGGNGKAVYP